MVLVVLLATLIILAADARIQNSIEVNNDENPLNLPKYPALAIQMSKEDYSYENRSPRIEYRGRYKFCVGRVVGRPVYDNVWNPINQTAYQNYYFRYVKVDMTECKFVLYQPPKIQELFFDNDQAYKNDNYGYNISLPYKQATFSSFYFLIYNPQTEQGIPDYKFKVRWTAYIDLADYSSPFAPIDEHYEPDAFDPAPYIWKFDD